MKTREVKTVTITSYYVKFQNEVLRLIQEYEGRGMKWKFTIQFLQNIIQPIQQCL